MADATFHIQGLDGVLRRMRTLPEKLQKKGLRAATRKGANVWKKAAVANYRGLGIDDPKTEVNIAKLIAVSEDRKGSKREGGIVMRVGVRGGARLSRDPLSAAHWRLVEFGSENNVAHPFMRSAFNSNIQTATSAVVTELNKQLDKLLPNVPSAV